MKLFSLPFTLAAPAKTNCLIGMLLALAISFGCPDSTEAQIDWINASSVDPWFDLDANWDGGVAPGAADDVRFGQNATYEVRFKGNNAVVIPEIGTLEVAAGDVSFLSKDAVHRNLKINGSSGSGSYSDFSVSGSGTSLYTDGVHIETLSGQILGGATMTLDGTFAHGASLTVEGTNGFDVSGTLNLIERADFYSQFSSLEIGRLAGSVGIVNVEDTGSTLNSNGINVGLNGTGFLNVTNGGLVNNDGIGFIGHQSGSTGTMTVSGATSSYVSDSALYVGRFGNGTMNIDSGAQVESTYDGYVGFGADSISTVNLTGLGSDWTIVKLSNNEGALFAGWHGNGSVNVSDGAHLNTTLGYIGFSAGSTGNVTLTDSDTRWFNDEHVYLGGTASADGGQGHLVIQDGGKMFVGNDIGTSFPPSSRLRIGDSNFNAQLWVRNGSTVFTDSQIGIGMDSAATGTLVVTGAGSRVENLSSLRVGGFGTGFLRIEDGGVLDTPQSDIGTLGSFATGTVTVSGTGSEYQSSAIFLGESSTINISDGGAVLNGSADIQGQITLTGNGTFWSTGSVFDMDGSNTASLEILDGAKMDIGWNGQFYRGTVRVSGAGSELNTSLGWWVDFRDDLTIENGAMVTNANAYLAELAQNDMDVIVQDAGSHWVNENLWVGENGTVNLQILNGGMITNKNGLIGVNTGSNGTALVSGAGSHWLNEDPDDVQGWMVVGNRGTGTLNIESGGAVTSKFGTIAFNGSAVGTANVSNSGSLWQVTEDMWIGGSGSAIGGSAELNLLDNGSVQVTGNTIVWDNATVNLASNGHYLGNTATNRGTINNSNGILEFSGTFDNEQIASVNGHGQFSATGGWSNDGTMSFDGPSDVYGDVMNSDVGNIIVNSAMTQFHGDVLMDAANPNVEVSEGAIATFLGIYNGGSTGTGTVQAFGELRPGNSPAIVHFGGDVELSFNTTTFIELGGDLAGEFDQLVVAGDMLVDGYLDVSLINGFLIDSTDQEFIFAEISGSQAGMFSGLAEGQLVNSYGELGLHITYSAGDGNDIGLYVSAIPEPSSGILLLIALATIGGRRKRNTPLPRLGE